MTLGWWLVVASLICLATKVSGYLMPRAMLDNPRLAHIAAMVTCGLLAALVVTQTFASDAGLTIDARLVAVAAATLALVLRAPFIAVVAIGALAAAATRALGWG